MAMKTGDAFEAKELPEEVKATLPNVYVDDLLMSLKYFIDEDKAHLRIIDQAVCARCEYKPCRSLTRAVSNVGAAGSDALTRTSSGNFPAADSGSPTSSASRRAAQESSTS